jgi:hypothetical protein
MLSFLTKYARNYFASQNGEEGILIEAIRRLDVDEGHAVEAGGANGLYCSNTALLLKDHNWSGLFVEGDYNLYLQCKQNWANYPNARSQCCYVDGKNINAFVDERCDLLSLDTDGSDYFIFDGLQAKPKIVIAEIDSSLNPDFASFNNDGGANYFAMTLLGITKGYFLLCHTGNTIFVDQQYRHLFPEITGDPLCDVESYFNRGWVK